MRGEAAWRTAGGAIFGTIARLRGARGLHPQGIAFDGRVELREDMPGFALMAPPLDRPGTLPAHVRLSRGLGLPPALPDFLGIAVRLPDLLGPGRPFDLLFTSSFGGPGGYHLLTVARSFDWRWYSTVMPYGAGDRRVVLGALADSGSSPNGDVAPPARGAGALEAARAAAISGTLRFRLAIATFAKPLIPFGLLHVHAPLPPDEAAALRFNPANVGDGIRLAGGPLDPLRDGAYRGSQRQQG